MRGQFTKTSIGLAIVVAALASCGSTEPELTDHQFLEKLAGSRLTQAEIDEQLELADLLCGFDSRVLVEIWDQLDARQLEFQDFVFGEHCPDRLSLYDDARPNTGTAPTRATTTTTTSTTTNASVLEDVRRRPSTDQSSTTDPTSSTSTTSSATSATGQSPTTDATTTTSSSTTTQSTTTATSAP